MRSPATTRPNLFTSLKEFPRLFSLSNLLSFRLSSLVLVLALLFSLFIKSDMRLPLVVVETAFLGLLYLIWVRDNLACIDVQRVLPSSGHQDKKLRVALRITNRGRVTAHQMMVSDLFPADQDCIKERIDFRSLAPGETRVLEYESACNGCFGTYSLPPVSIVVSDFLGIFRRHRQVSTKQTFTLFPKLVHLANFEALGVSRTSTSGAHFMAKGDLNIAIAGVRDYVAGDALRTIHWPLSAKHGKLIVKEFERQAVPVVHILCDVCRTALTHGSRESGFERNLISAVSIAQASSQAGLSTNFAMYTHSLHLRRLESGIENFSGFLRWICDERELGDEELSGLVSRYVSLTSRGDLLFVFISDLTGELEKKLGEVAPFVAMGVNIIVMVALENSEQPRDVGVDWTLGEALDVPVCFYSDPDDLPLLLQQCGRRRVE